MAHRMTGILPTILQLAGLALLVAVCFAVHVLLGASALGLALFGVGTLLDRPVTSRGSNGSAT